MAHKLLISDAMKLKLISCLLLVAAAISTRAADLGPVPTNLPPITTTTPATTDTNKPTAPPKTLTAEFTNSVGMIMVQANGEMWAGKYDVTQKDFQKVMGFNPSAFQSPNNPVD